jgi:hypothetical protein
MNDSTLDDERIELRNTKCLLLGSGTSQYYRDLWYDKDDNEDYKILGLQPYNSKKLREYLQKHPLLTQLYKGYPQYLDHLHLNSQLNSVNIVQVATGSIHSLYLTEDGLVYAMAYNSDRQLGLNHTTSMEVPTLITYFVDHGIRIRSICAGKGWFSAFISTTGKLYTTGNIGKSPRQQITEEPIPQNDAYPNDTVEIFGSGCETLVFQMHSKRVFALSKYPERCGAFLDFDAECVEVFCDANKKSFDFPIRKIEGTERCIFILRADTMRLYGGGSIAEFNSPNSFQLIEQIPAIREFTCSWSGILYLTTDQKLLTYPDIGFTDTHKYGTDLVLSSKSNEYFICDRLTFKYFKFGDHYTERSLVDVDSSIPMNYELVNGWGSYFNTILLLKGKNKHVVKYRSNLQRCAHLNYFGDCSVNTL